MTNDNQPHIFDLPHIILNEDDRDNYQYCIQKIYGLGRIKDIESITQFFSVGGVDSDQFLGSCIALLSRGEHTYIFIDSDLEESWILNSIIGVYEKIHHFNKVVVEKYYKHENEFIRPINNHNNSIGPMFDLTYFKVQ